MFETHYAFYLQMSGFRIDSSIWIWCKIVQHERKKCEKTYHSRDNYWKFPVGKENCFLTALLLCHRIKKFKPVFKLCVGKIMVLAWTRSVLRRRGIKKNCIRLGIIIKNTHLARKIQGLMAASCVMLHWYVTTVWNFQSWNVAIYHLSDSLCEKVFSVHRMFSDSTCMPD